MTRVFSVDELVRSVASGSVEYVEDTERQIREWAKLFDPRHLYDMTRSIDYVKGKRQGGQQYGFLHLKRKTDVQERLF